MKNTKATRKIAAMLAAVMMMTTTAIATIGASAWAGAEYQFTDTCDHVDICPAHSDGNHDYKFTGESRKIVYPEK